MAQLSRYLLAFLKGAGGALPGIGPLVAGGLEVVQHISDEASNQELEQRLQHLLETGQQLPQGFEELREDVQVLTALAVISISQQDTLLSWLESNGRPAAPAELASFAASASLVAYRARVALDYQYVDHRGVQGAGRAAHVTALPIDDVYVLPRLIPERFHAETSDRERTLLKLLEDRDLPSAQHGRLVEEYSTLTGERWGLGSTTQARTLPVGDAFAHLRTAVVLGRPGVGKSALVRYLARTCAMGEESTRERLGWSEQLTPIVLPLARFADARTFQPGLTLPAYLEQLMIQSGGDALRTAVTRELQNGRVIILLDGIDEIPDYFSRLQVVREVDQFLLNYPVGRCITTSRPYGYIRLAGEIPHFELPNFSKAQVRLFVHNWQRAFERSRHPDAPHLDKAADEASELLAELERNPKVAELATNPLMLVIIALVHYEQTRLPQERVQLYNRAVNTLMDTWNYGRSLVTVQSGGISLPPDRLIRVWSAIAEWTRHTKPTGIIHRAELKRKLVEILEDQELDDRDPDATAESYLQAAADRAGLLEERGPEVFAFWHATFEEFLAAVELTTPTARAVERLMPLRDDPRWREVILLAVGYVGIVLRDRETATDIVRAIAERDQPPFEPVLHPYLRLAAACVADDVGVMRTLAEQVVVRLAEVVLEQPYALLQRSFIDAVRGLPRLSPKPETVHAIAKLTSNSHWAVRMEATRWLSNASADNPAAQTLCRETLKDEDPDVRCHAALGLLRAGDYTSETWQGLEGFRSTHARIESAVREFLNEAPSEVLATLHPLLTSDDDHKRSQAADLLAELGDADLGLREEQAQTLRSCLVARDNNVRLRAVRTLHKLGETDNRLVESVKPLLESAIPYTRLEAIEVLHRLGYDENELADSLLPLLLSREDYLRNKSIETLTELTRSSPDIKRRISEALYGILQTGDNYDRHCAVEVLSELRYGDPSLRPQLISTLRSVLTTRDQDLRIEALRLLHSLNPNDDSIAEALLSLLRNGNRYRRRAAASFAIDFRVRDKAVKDEVVTVLRSFLVGGRPDERLQAAQQLRQLGYQADEHFTEALKLWITSNHATPDFPRRQAAELMVDLVADSSTMREELVRTTRTWLNSFDTSTRMDAAHIMHDLNLADEELIDTLRSWLTSDDDYLPIQAAGLLHELGEANDELMQRFRTWLQSRYENRRRLAAELLLDLRADDQELRDEVLQILRSLLEADDNLLRIEAAGLLNDLGEATEEAAEALYSWLTDKDSYPIYYRTRAARLLIELRDGDTALQEELVPLVRSWLSVSTSYERVEAAELLSDLDTADEELMQTLRSWLTTDDDYLNTQAAKLLYKLEGNEDLVHRFQTWLESEQDSRRRLAAELLLDLRPDDQDLRDTLAQAVRPLLSADEDFVRTQAAQLMLQLGHREEAAKSLYPVLTATDYDPVHDDVVALKMMNETGQATILLEQIATIMSPPPWTALGACQKVIDKSPLTHTDGEALAALTKHSSGHSISQRRILRLLFTWLALTLTPGERIILTA